MKNKTIAIIGVVQLVLSVITSFTYFIILFNIPLFLVYASSLLTMIFTMMAVYRLWVEIKYASIIFAITGIIIFIFNELIVVSQFIYDITNIGYYLISLWVIFLLYKY